MATDPVAFLHDLTPDHIPAPVMDRARLWLLDLIGVAAGGLGTDLSRLIRHHATQHFAAGGRGAHILFDGRHVSPAGAALAGGMTIDALDAHDGHRLTKGHTGCGVFPALLALAESENTPCDRAFLAALVCGYEFGTRAGIALHRSAQDYHTSGAWVALACAGLGARLMGLGQDATRHALGIAEYHGPRSQMMRCIDHPTMVKDGSGWGAMAGVSAAALARDGFTGAPALTVEDPALADIWDHLGQRWLVMEQYFKHFPVCRWAQPPVQAALDLRAAHAIAPDQIEGIEIETFHESIRLATVHPKTTEEAQYSTAFPVAVALARGHIGPADMAEAAFRDPVITRLAGAIQMRESSAFNAAFPARRIARVTLRLLDGRHLTSAPTEARGDPETPPDWAEAVSKFHRYADGPLGRERAEAIVTTVKSLGHGEGLGELLSLILPPVAPDATH